MSSDTETGTPENLIDLLDKLVPPSEPAPISLVPETAGWYLLALLLTISVFGLIRVLFKRHKANAYRRDAIAALPLAAKDAGMLARIIRHTALVTFPRAEVASLYGDDWAAFLERTCEGKPIRKDLAQQIACAPYDPAIPVSDELIDTVRHWIVNHKRGPNI